MNALTERERQVLGLMAQGASNTAIAHQLRVSAKTVESHVRSIFTKLGIYTEPRFNPRVVAVLRFLSAA